MILKNLFLLGDIGFYGINVRNCVNSISSQIGKQDVVAILGDNFYPSGLSSRHDLQIDTFNQVFQPLISKQVPIYSILGNHDYLQDPSVQVNSKELKWFMRDYYYEQKFDNVNLLFVDTCQLSESTWVDTQKIESVHGQTHGILVEKQMEWLEKKLQNDSDKLKIVIGHYPILTNGYYRGKVDALKEKLMPLFQKYKMNLFISGHEHNIQHIQENEFHQIVVGSSSENRQHERYCVPENVLIDNTDSYFGKMTFSSNSSIVSMEYINNRNRSIYTLPCLRSCEKNT